MNQYTDDLKQQIESILNWGPSVHWQKRDFTELRQRVVAHTGEDVDANDLQILWQSSADPPLVVLDSLARFADYEDWSDFRSRNAYGVVDHDEETRLTHAPMWEIPPRWVIVICWLSVLASVIVGIVLVWNR